MKLKLYSGKGVGKDYTLQIKCYKAIVISMIGRIGWLFATPRTKAILIETAKEFVDELSGK